MTLSTMSKILLAILPVAVFGVRSAQTLGGQMHVGTPPGSPKKHEFPSPDSPAKKAKTERDVLKELHQNTIGEPQLKPVTPTPVPELKKEDPSNMSTAMEVVSAEEDIVDLSGIDELLKNTSTEVPETPGEQKPQLLDPNMSETKRWQQWRDCFLYGIVNMFRSLCHQEMRNLEKDYDNVDSQPFFIKELQSQYGIKGMHKYGIEFIVEEMGKHFGFDNGVLDFSTKDRELSYTQQKVAEDYDAAAAETLGNEVMQNIIEGVQNNEIIGLLLRVQHKPPPGKTDSNTGHAIAVDLKKFKEVLEGTFQQDEKHKPGADHYNSCLKSFPYRGESDEILVPGQNSHFVEKTNELIPFGSILVPGKNSHPQMENVLIPWNKIDGMSVMRIPRGVAHPSPKAIAQAGLEWRKEIQKSWETRYNFEVGQQVVINNFGLYHPKHPDAHRARFQGKETTVGIVVKQYPIQKVQLQDFLGGAQVAVKWGGNIGFNLMCANWLTKIDQRPVDPTKVVEEVELDFDEARKNHFLTVYNIDSTPIILNKQTNDDFVEVEDFFTCAKTKYNKEQWDQLHFEKIKPVNEPDPFPFENFHLVQMREYNNEFGMPRGLTGYVISANVGFQERVQVWFGDKYCRPIELSKNWIEPVKERTQDVYEKERQSLKHEYDEYVLFTQEKNLKLNLKDDLEFDGKMIPAGTVGYIMEKTKTLSPMKSSNHMFSIFGRFVTFPVEKVQNSEKDDGDFTVDLRFDQVQGVSILTSDEVQQLIEERGEASALATGEKLKIEDTEIDDELPICDETIDPLEKTVDKPETGKQYEVFYRFFNEQTRESQIVLVENENDEEDEGQGQGRKKARSRLESPMKTGVLDFGLISTDGRNDDVRQTSGLRGYCRKMQ